MKKFIELEIRNSEEKLVELLNLLKASETNKWKFERKLTKDYSLNISISEEKVACFKANSTKYFDATIWFAIIDGVLKVSNIVSRKVPYLGKDIYNLTVTDFYEEFVSKYVEGNFKINLTSNEVTIEEIANKATADKLKKWESLCNRSTGNSHPYDRERWFDFIKTAVDTNSNLTVGDLEQWLTEERNWFMDEENSITERIVLDFEYGIDLLKYYVGKGN